MWSSCIIWTLRQYHMSLLLWWFFIEQSNTMVWAKKTEQKGKMQCVVNNTFCFLFFELYLHSDLKLRIPFGNDMANRSKLYVSYKKSSKGHEKIMYILHWPLLWIWNKNRSLCKYHVAITLLPFNRK